ncbi:MAG: hypothetical protein M1818_005265 [Claussenomyces sp. TS43310]|nr:MAG: hypothetical protein M1818_005265 [Claussenomyces sp. TS43310]
MSISPIITFKAGKCEVDTASKPYKVSAVADPGYIYLYSEDEMIHFCWRARNVPLDAPELDLMILGDARFEPYEYKSSDQPTAKTNGRIFALKFSSSSQRYLFWLQSKSQARNGDPSWFSPRDLKIGQIVDTLLQGEDVNVSDEIAQIQGNERGDGDDDETMEDAEGQADGEHRPSVSGGAGPDATGGDIRSEGSQARDGGADGGRAASSSVTDAATAVQNFLNSLKGNQNLAGGSGSSQSAEGKLYTTLSDLLPTSVTIPTIDAATPAQLDNLLNYLPPTILILSQESSAQIDGMVEPNAGSATAALEAMSVDQKRALIKRVVRSPQFHQSLGSLTMAIRDGGLPSIGDALGLKVHNGGLVRGGSVPQGGGEAVEAFVEGVKRAVEEKP